MRLVEPEFWFFSGEGTVLVIALVVGGLGLAWRRWSK